ncbi:MAG: acyloxyacyl hydrolase, partial [Gammaproteobacteria bacterium]|nr:acyloxyacyl hydrolase [Gammaproteobacteria bacterium]
RFRNRVRLGLAVHHISNAGLASDDNPGANTIALYLSAPFDMLFGP